MKEYKNFNYEVMEYCSFVKLNKSTHRVVGSVKSSRPKGHQSSIRKGGLK
jgi:hypothetical protein